MRQILITLLVLSLYLPIADAAGIQKWVDEKGRTQYGERPPSSMDASAVKETVSVVDTQALEPTAKLYSTRRCGYCKKAKAFMKSNNIKYREYDIEEDSVARARYKKLGGKGVPVLELRGRTLFGFSKANYKRFFNI